jgi:hypothetical protein
LHQGDITRHAIHAAYSIRHTTDDHLKGTPPPYDPRTGYEPHTIRTTYGTRRMAYGAALVHAPLAPRTPTALRRCPPPLVPPTPGSRAEAAATSAPPHCVHSQLYGQLCSQLHRTGSRAEAAATPAPHHWAALHGVAWCCTPTLKKIDDFHTFAQKKRSWRGEIEEVGREARGETSFPQDP